MVEQDVDQKRLIASVVLLERFVREIYPIKHSSAIQPLQWSILRYLDRMPEDRCEVRWIAEFLGLTRAPVSRAVATLLGRNLVSQSTSGEDGRNKTIELTSRGNEALLTDPIMEAAERVRVLPTADQVNLMKALRALTLQQRGPRDDQS